MNDRHIDEMRAEWSQVQSSLSRDLGAIDVQLPSQLYAEKLQLHRQLCYSKVEAFRRMALEVANEPSFNLPRRAEEYLEGLESRLARRLEDHRRGWLSGARWELILASELPELPPGQRARCYVGGQFKELTAPGQRLFLAKGKAYVRYHDSATVKEFFENGTYSICSGMADHEGLARMTYRDWVFEILREEFGLPV